MSARYGGERQMPQMNRKRTGVRNMIDEVSRKRYERELAEKLHPSNVQSTLVSCGLFLLAYELLRPEIVTQTRIFVDHEYDCLEPDSPPFSEQYKKEVMHLA